jgi:hypothetical protein
MEPVDGVADSPEESFRVSVAMPAASACVRLEDREGNSTTVGVTAPR